MRNRLSTGARIAACVVGVMIASQTALIAQTDMMIMGSAEAEPGDTEVRLPIKLRHVRDIHAYSVALTFPREVVSVRSLDICATEIAATIRPDFNASHIEPSLGHATLGVITEFDGATGERVIEGLEPGQERVIATLVLDVHPDAREGVYPIELTQGLGAAGIVNETSSAGDSVEPDLVHGFLRVGTRNVMHVSSTFGFCGAQPQAILSVRGSNADELNGLSIGITFDWEKAEVLEILAGLDVTREMGFPETERFELAQMDWTRVGDKCRIRIGFIWDAAPPFDQTQVLSAHTGPNPDREYAQIKIRPLFDHIDCDTEERIAFEMDEDDRPGALNSTFVVGTTSLIPKRYGGGIHYCTGAVQGRVVNGATGQPIEGALVDIEPTFQSVTTSAAGTFSFQDLPPGGYFFRVSHAAGNGFFTEYVSDYQLECGPSADNDLGDIILHPISRARCSDDMGGSLSTFDNNQDGRHDIADIFPVVGYLFQGHPEPAIFCLDAIETNGDNRIDLSDAIYFLNYLFVGGALPIAPFPECGFREVEIRGCEHHRCADL